MVWVGERGDESESVNEEKFLYTIFFNVTTWIKPGFLKRCFYVDVNQNVSLTKGEKVCNKLKM